MQLKKPSLYRQEAFVDGQWTQGQARKTFVVSNPASSEIVARVADLDEHDVRMAIAAAASALPKWRALPAKERARIMRRWFDLIIVNLDDLAILLTTEQGKSLTEARGEVAYGASFIEWFAEESKRVYGDLIPAPSAQQRILVMKEPIGVVAAITPWNFPNAMITRKIAPALAAGCTVVVKPAEETPLSALALAALAEEAGFPRGVLNIVTTTRAAEVGLELTENAMIRKVSFTGSTEVGKILMRQSSSTLKKLSLELGGNAPFIVFEDADLELAIKGAVASKFRNSGQTCVCTNRFLIHSRIYDEFADRLVAAVRALKVGDGFEDGVQQGPLINADAVAKVEEHVRDALAKGAELVLGGKRHARGGTFFEPTVFKNATTAMMFANAETFGPVAGLIRFESEAEAIRIANDTAVGLAAYFFTQNLARVWRVAEALECGMVGVNEGLISNEVAPFGGIKESGMGREGSKYGIDDYIETKYVMLGGMN